MLYHRPRARPQRKDATYHNATVSCCSMLMVIWSHNYLLVAAAGVVTG
jgi:hypothetical protein